MVANISGQEIAGAALIYFFCDFRVAASCTALTLLRACTRQILELCDQSSKPESVLATMVDEAASSDGAEALFFKALGLIPRSAILVLDGVDQCSDIDQGIIITCLARAITEIKKPTKILLSSRTEIGYRLAATVSTYCTICLTPANTTEDMRLFIREIIATKLDTRELRLKDRDLRLQIEAVLSANAEGMYVSILQAEDTSYSSS